MISNIFKEISFPESNLSAYRILGMWVTISGTRINEGFRKRLMKCIIPLVEKDQVTCFLHGDVLKACELSKG